MRTINPADFPAHYDHERVEKEWCKKWEEWQIYHYDPSRSHEDTYAVDTPPPTVSGSLHVGHVFSYTHTDLIVRFQRMKGRNIFYPIGWDDNGLPTERRVQNYFHVRCDPALPFDPNLQLTIATPQERKAPPRVVSRLNFINLCLELTREDEQVFMELWRRVGLSVDWRQEYSTISDRSRHIAQLSFLDLFEKGHVYSLRAPTMWDVDFQTAVAQAEVEERSVSGNFYHIRFGVEASNESFVIATTRPELLPACVGVAAHPDDQRYRSLVGKRAITPLFRCAVPIFSSELVDPEKGTGILMVCTFGDATDVLWWKEKGLELRQIIGHNGRLLPVAFGSDPWSSLEPSVAQQHYERLSGKSIKAAQKEIVDTLRQPDAAATGSEVPLQGESRPIEHMVKFYEKGDRPLEFVSTRQWFVRLLDKKERLLANGDRIVWHPDFMRLRYRTWTEGLQYDWCISRQRYFGVPFPVWYPLDSDGNPDPDRPLVAPPESLPVDPMIDSPAGYEEVQRNQPGGFVGEADVFDTWFTSSMTPQICTGWVLDSLRHQKLFPMDLRPHSHEIIRTWTFYTIAKSLLHENSIPWTNVAISGWVLDPDRKKMSKSLGNVLTPMHVLDKFGSDAVRYWAANARLGNDTAFDETVLKIGKRLITKIYNASKFALSQSADDGPICKELDLAFLQKLRNAATSATESFEAFEYAAALNGTERFFWESFTDTFLELVKFRARQSEDAEGRSSAVAALRLGLNVLLRLFAPFLPYLTEEVWSWTFADTTGCRSIHQAAWPGESDFANIALSENTEIFDTAGACLSAIHKAKSESKVSVGHPISHIVVGANNVSHHRLAPALSDVMAAARVQQYDIEQNQNLKDNEFEMREVEFVSNSETTS